MLLFLSLILRSFTFCKHSGVSRKTGKKKITLWKYMNFWHHQKLAAFRNLLLKTKQFKKLKTRKFKTSITMWRSGNKNKNIIPRLGNKDKNIICINYSQIYWCTGFQKLPFVRGFLKFSSTIYYSHKTKEVIKQLWVSCSVKATATIHLQKMFPRIRIELNKNYQLCVGQTVIFSINIIKIVGSCKNLTQ